MNHFENENPIFSLNGIPNPKWLRVTEIADRLLPMMNVLSTNVPGRTGHVRMGKANNTREIQIFFTIMASNEQQMRERARILANDFLSHSTPVKYINYKEPDGYYMVDIQSGGELREQLILGRCLITLLATDPHFYSHETTILNPPSNIIEIVNNGAETFPKISFEMINWATEASVITGDRFMQIGSSEFGNTGPQDTMILNEHLTSTAAWFPAPEMGNTIIVGDTIVGDLGFQQRPNSFGPGDATGLWRGSGLRRTLPRTATEWHFISEFDFSQPAAHPRMRDGRVRFTFLDAQGQRVADVSLGNSTNSFRPNMRARFNQGGVMRDIISHGHPDWGGTVVGMDGITHWMGASVWWVEFIRNRSMIEVRMYRGHYGGWRDAVVAFASIPISSLNDIAQIQIDFATRREVGPVEYMGVRRIQLESLDVDLDEFDPWILRPNDKIEIDSERGLLSRNGFRWFDHLSPDSRFPILHHGMNQIVLPENVRNIEIEFRERRL